MLLIAVFFYLKISNTTFIIIDLKLLPKVITQLHHKSKLILKYTRQLLSKIIIKNYSLMHNKQCTKDTYMKITNTCCIISWQDTHEIPPHWGPQPQGRTQGRFKQRGHSRPLLSQTYLQHIK